MILQSINLNQQVSGTEMGWIIASGILIILCTTVFSLLCNRVQKDRDLYMWPTLKQVEEADDDQITWWVKNLPIASNDAEMKIIDLIVQRYLNV